MYIAGSALAAVAVGAALALFSSGAGATTATTVSANTHAANHDDTTSVSGTATRDSVNGPVWAEDNLTVKITATPAASGYNVMLTVTGSFAGFADPRSAAEGSSDPGGPLVSSGSVKGTYNLTASAGTPNPANLPAQQDPTTGLRAMVAQFFSTDVTNVAGGSYNFAYTKVGGAVYTQSG